ncbi:MAG TPA: GNVR domain-containing protein [Gammaproteobacteria bacterium]|nr:GNVR domain-containing protein [Gammaproteobacteria bacterium]
MPDSSHEASTLAQAQALWKRRKWLAIGVFAVVFSVLAALVLTLPDLYRTTTTVLVSPGQAYGSGESGPAAAGNLDARLDSISQQVLSRPRLERLITEFNLYPRLRRGGSLDGAVTQMRRDIRFERTQAEQQWGQKSTIAFNLSYQGWKPQTVAQVTNDLASFYLQDNANINQRQAAGASADLQAQLQQITHKLSAQQAQINAFRQRHMGALPEQESANLSTLNRLNTQLASNSASQEHAMELREDILKQMSAAGVPDLAQLQQKLLQLRTRYTDKYPEVVRVKAEIAALQKQGGTDNRPGGQTSGVLHQRLAQVDAELNALHKQAASLHAEITDYQQRVENVPLVQQQMQALTQGYAETQDVYSGLLKRYEQARITDSTVGQSDGLFQVLDSALPPQQPVAPSRLRLLVMSLIVALAVAIACVFVFERMDSSFHSARDLRAFTDVPVIAIIPRIVTQRDAWRRRLRAGAIVFATVVLVVIAARVGYQLGHGNQQLVWTLARHANSATTT